MAELLDTVYEAAGMRPRVGASSLGGGEGGQSEHANGLALVKMRSTQPKLSRRLHESEASTRLPQDPVAGRIAVSQEDAIKQWLYAKDHLPGSMQSLLISQGKAPHSRWGMMWPATGAQALCQKAIRQPCVVLSSAPSPLCQNIGKVTPSFFSDRGFYNLPSFRKLSARHPRRVLRSADADVYAFGAPTLARLHEFVSLPVRPAQRPYLLWIRGLDCIFCCTPSHHQRTYVPKTPRAPSEKYICLMQLHNLSTRHDVVFVNIGLADHDMVDDAGQLPGVTFAHPSYLPKSGLLPGTGWNPRRQWAQGCDGLPPPTKQWLSFRGSCANGGLGGTAWSTARMDLARIINHSSMPTVKFECSDGARPSASHYSDIMNTTYALIPHGEGRWNRRFYEAVDATAIPVIVADGWVPPFEPLIDWTRACVYVSEAALRSMKSASDFLRLLPNNLTAVQRMRRAVCKVRERYMMNDHAKFEGLLQAVHQFAHRRNTHHEHDLSQWRCRTSYGPFPMHAA